MDNNMVNITPVPSSQVDIADVHLPVVVNLRAAITASGEVHVFGPSAESVSNVIWCDVSLNHTTLYDGSSNAIFEFWEPADACGNIYGRIAKAGGSRDADVDRNALIQAGLFRNGLQAVLEGGMDASQANPFQAYDGNATYTHYDNFGRLALAYAAEGMFGHPSATAAITNDVAIVDGFNKPDTTPADTLVAPTVDNQALAQRLAAALYNLTENDAQAVVQVVLGQDASRATNEDNSALQTDVHSALRFYAGDVIYVKITLENFRPVIGAPGQFLVQQWTPPAPPTQDYYLRIVLG